MRFYHWCCAFLGLAILTTGCTSSRPLTGGREGQESNRHALITTQFSDNFEDGNYTTRWTREDGTWSGITDGSKVLRLESNTGYARASAGDKSWTDQVVEARFKPVSWNSTSCFMVLAARFVDKENYYYITLRNNNTIELKRLRGNSPFRFGNAATFTVTPGQWYTVRLEAIGNTLKAYVGGNLMLSATDTDATLALPSGKIAVGVYYGQVNVDNVVVKSGVEGAPGSATALSPLPDSPQVAPPIELRWTAGTDAVSHQVFFGETYPPPPIGPPQTSTTYAPGLATIKGNTTYYWGVDVTYPSGTVAQGTVWKFTTKTLFPPGKATLTVPPDGPAIGATGVSLDPTLSWTAGSNATSYEVWYGLATGAWTQVQPDPTGTSTSLSNLFEDSDYQWRVDAKNNDGVTPGDIWTFHTGLSGKPKRATLKGPGNTEKCVEKSRKLEWNPGALATRHYVCFGTDPKNLSCPPSWQTASSAPIPVSMIPGQVYWWRVDEENDIGRITGDDWSFTALEPPGLATDPFPGHTVSGVSVTETLRWKPGACAKSHSISLVDPQKGTLSPIVSVVAPEWSPPDLQPNVDYLWQVDEVNSLGTASATTPWSFRTGDPVMPGQATSPDPKEGAINVPLKTTLVWKSGIPAPATHEVYLGKSRNLDQPGDHKGSPLVNEPWFKTPELEPNTVYYWRIDEKNAAGTQPGLPWSFTTGGMPGQATLTDPTNDAQNVSVTPELKWTRGSGTVDQHLIFWGPTQDSMKQMDISTDTNRDVKYTIPTAKALDPGVYYWRIDEKNSLGTTPGEVWKFTTTLPAVQPLQAKITRCTSDGRSDKTEGGGLGHSPATRAIKVHFAYATRSHADDDRKKQAADATQKVEVCVVDLDSAGKRQYQCDQIPAQKVQDTRFVVYPKNDGKEEWGPKVEEVATSKAEKPPLDPKEFTLPLYGDCDPNTGTNCTTKGFEYAEAANKGKFVILRVNGQPYDEARRLGGTCPLPYLLKSGTNFEIFGTDDKVTDPWADLGLNSCKGGGLFPGKPQCVSLDGVEQLNTELDGLTKAHENRMNAKECKNPNDPNDCIPRKSWRNGVHKFCGTDGKPADCKGLVSVYTTLDGGTGATGPVAAMTFNTESVSNLSDWSNSFLDVLAHEMIHSLHGTYKPFGGRAWLTEGHTNAMGYLQCIEGISNKVDAYKHPYVSPGELGSGADSEGLDYPWDNVLGRPYQSSIYWWYFMEQYALPLDTYPYARPSGGKAANVQSSPTLPLGDRARSSDEGSDLLPLLYAKMESAGGEKAPVLQLADELFTTNMKRSLDNMVFDFHTASLLKDYKGVPEEWRFQWVGDFNAGGSGLPDPAKPGTFKPVADRIENIKPFQNKGDDRKDRLRRATRIVDQAKVGPSDTVANGMEEVINAYGAAYLSVKPTTENSVVTVSLRPAHHAAPRFRIFTVDPTGVPKLLDPQCTKVEGTGAGSMRTCAHGTDGSVVVDVGTGSGSTKVDEILIVASASAQPASFFYEIGAGAPTIEILGPLESHKALVGTTNPSRSVRPFLVEFVVRDKGGTLVPGLTDKQVRLSAVSGGTTTPIPGPDVRLLPLSGGVYYAKAKLPLSALPYTKAEMDLKIEYLDSGGSTLASDTEPKALQVIDASKKVATQLLIDVSDSMNEDDKKKLNAVKQATKFLLDTIPNGDELGVITYNHDANTLQDIVEMTESVRNDMKDKIDNLTAGGCTSLGDALLEASSNFKTRYKDGDPWLSIQMLTDGINTAQYTPDYYYTNAAYMDKLPYNHDGEGVLDGCNISPPKCTNCDWAPGKLNWWQQTYQPRVTTIAFGQNADLIELANIANRTKGVFVYADEGGVGQLRKTTLEVADAFRQGYTLAAHASRIGAARVASTSENDLPAFTVEKNAGDLQVSLLSLQGTPSGWLYLVDPTGARHTSVLHDNTAVYRVTEPKAGPWHWDYDVISHHALPATTASDDNPVFVETVVSGPLVLLAFADVEYATTDDTDDQRWVGKDVFIRAVPTDGGDLLNVNVSATVLDPSGVSSNLTLLDDGTHGDGAANDGVYGAILRSPSLAGAYSVKVLASGNTPNVGDFQRETTVGFNLHKAPDGDKDGVPDYCDPQPNVPDADEDPDRDGLTNAQECSIGTDPRNPDTDKGGTIDGPEVAKGGNPRDPSDDLVRPYSIHVSPCHRKVLISPEVVPTDSVEIEVSSSGPIGPYSLVYTGAAAPSFKLDAPTGNEHCYRMRTLGSLQTAWSPPYCIRTSTAQSDPHPPMLRASLADRTTWLHSRKARLDVFATDKKLSSDNVPRCDEVIESGVTDMQLSFDQSFTGATWRPYTPIVDLDLPSTGDEFYAWVRVRDGAGNVSDSVLVTIRVVSPPAHQTSDFVIYGLGGARLEDGATLVGANGKYGDIANRGTTVTEIGATAVTGNVVSNGDVFLRAAGKIDGYVETAKTFIPQTGATVTGTITENATIVLPDLPAFTIRPGTGTAVRLEPDQVWPPLSPGNYGDVSLKSRSKLTLQSGTYHFGIVQTEPDSQLILNKTSGPIYIHMSALTHRGKVIDAAGDHYGKTLFAVSGSDPIFIEGPFVGTLLAPNADATIGTSSAPEHRGVFQARTVLVRSKATLYHLPWSYAQ